MCLVYRSTVQCLGIHRVYRLPAGLYRVAIHLPHHFEAQHEAWEHLHLHGSARVLHCSLHHVSIHIVGRED